MEDGKRHQTPGSIYERVSQKQSFNNSATCWDLKRIKHIVPVQRIAEYTI